MPNFGLSGYYGVYINAVNHIGETNYASIHFTVIVPSTDPTNPSTETQTNPSTVLLLGDANGNGIVDIMDATAIQRYLAKYSVVNEENVLKCRDVNGDGVDIMDAAAIQRFLAQYHDAYPIGELITG